MKTQQNSAKWNKNKSFSEEDTSLYLATSIIKTITKNMLHTEKGLSNSIQSFLFGMEKKIPDPIQSNEY